MTGAEIGYLSAGDLARLYRSGDVSPTEVVDAVLRHIAAADPMVSR
jgi:hypothetical protein